MMQKVPFSPNLYTTVWEVFRNDLRDLLEWNANWPFLLQDDVAGDGSTKTNIKMKTKYKRLWLQLYSLNTNWHLSHLTRFSFLFHDSSTVNLKSWNRAGKNTSLEMLWKPKCSAIHELIRCTAEFEMIWIQCNLSGSSTSKCLFIIVSQKISVHIHISCILTNKQDFFN
jgi:hypothetical protein